MRDISTEEEEREVLKAMIESCVDPIIVIDTKGIVQKCNSACTKVFGYTKNEMINHNVSLLMPEKHAKQHDTYLSNFLSKSQIGEGNCKKRHTSVVGAGRDVIGKQKDGSLVPLFLSVSEFCSQSNSKQKHGFIGIMRDMTEKQNAIAAEMEREKSEALLRNVLPSAISDRLKGHGEGHTEVQIADAYDDVSILFADIVGFTNFCSGRSAMDVVHYLNQIFRKFDDLVDKYELEKV